MFLSGFRKCDSCRFLCDDTNYYKGSDGTYYILCVNCAPDFNPDLKVSEKVD